MTRKKILFVILICSLLLILITTSFGNGKNNIVTNVLESKDQRTVVNFEVGNFDREEVIINGERFTKIKCPKEGVLLNAGAPELPYISRSIIIPDDAVVKAKVLASEYEDIITDTDRNSIQGESTAQY